MLGDGVESQFSIVSQEEDSCPGRVYIDTPPLQCDQLAAEAEEEYLCVAEIWW